jgi:hypothetical protein
MHESEERGVLITGGSPWSEKDWAAAVGGNMDVTLSLISELLAKGVAKRRQTDNAIYCARMVREEEKKRQVNARVKAHRERNAVCNAPETPPPRVTEDEDEDEDGSSTQGEGEGGKARLNLPVPEPEVPLGELAEEIYQLYPLKVGKPAAIRSIVCALKRHDSIYLRERTELYAKTVSGTDTLIPNPSTWFNQERFNDDSSTWTRRSSNNGKPNQPNPRNVGYAAGQENRAAAIGAAARRNSEKPA